MATDNLRDAFSASRQMGFHEMDEYPPKESKLSVKLAKALNNLSQAFARGHVPKPDVKRGRTNLWRQSTIDNYKAGNWEGKKWRKNAKKAENRANGPQPKTTPAKKQSAKKIAHSRNGVNTETSVQL